MSDSEINKLMQSIRASVYSSLTIDKEALSDQAKAFQTICRNVNQDLTTVEQQIKAGRLTDPLVTACRDGKLLSRFEALDFPELERWTQLLTLFDLPKPVDLNRGAAATLKEAFAWPPTMVRHAPVDNPMQQPRTTDEPKPIVDQSSREKMMSSYLKPPKLNQDRTLTKSNVQATRGMPAIPRFSAKTPTNQPQSTDELPSSAPLTSTVSIPSTSNSDTAAISEVVSVTLQDNEGKSRSNASTLEHKDSAKSNSSASGAVPVSAAKETDFETSIVLNLLTYAMVLLLGMAVAIIVALGYQAQRDADHEVYANKTKLELSNLESRLEKETATNKDMMSKIDEKDKALATLVFENRRLQRLQSDAKDNAIDVKVTESSEDLDKSFQTNSQSAKSPLKERNRTDPLQSPPVQPTAIKPNRPATRVRFLGYSNPTLPIVKPLKKAELWTLDLSQHRFTDRIELIIDEKSKFVFKRGEVGTPPFRLFQYSTESENTKLEIVPIFKSILSDQFLYLEFEDGNSFLLGSGADSTIPKRIKMSEVITLSAEPFNAKFLDDAKLRVETEAKWESSSESYGPTRKTLFVEARDSKDEKRRQMVHLELVKVNQLSSENIAKTVFISVSSKNETERSGIWNDKGELPTISTLIAKHKDKQLHIFVDNVMVDSPDGELITLEFQFDLVFDMRSRGNN